MSIKKAIGFFILSFVLTSHTVLGVTIGVSPGILRFPQMIKEGYAEESVIITTNSPVLLKGYIDVEGDIAPWISFLPETEKFNVSVEMPYRLKVMVRPSADAANGNYSGIIRFVTDQVAVIERGAGSSVLAAVAIKINIEIIGQQIIACRAGAFSISSAEIQDPFRVSLTVYNDGNVRLRPEVVVTVRDQKNNLQMTKTFLAQEILPTTSQRVQEKIENDLVLGQYFGEIFVKECGVASILSFDIVEEGGIADIGEFIGIRTNKISYAKEPTPFIPIFRNTGERTVLAKFKGQIRFLDDDKVIKVIETDALEVEPGQEMKFNLFFTPEHEGAYQILGRIIYNNKITFEEKSAVLNVLTNEGKTAPQYTALMILIGYIVVGLLILILIGKIRKAKRKKQFREL